MRVEVAGAIAYAYTGTRLFDASRPTVVFVHGAAHDHGVFALQSRYFAFHGRNVLAVDLPGHGRSEGPPLRSVEAIADWLAALLDAVGARDAAIIGHSMGALAALEAAARHPARVAKLALLGLAVPMAVSEALLAAAHDEPQSAYAMINGWSHSPAHQLGGNPVPGMWMTGTALALMERNAPGILEADLRACNDYGGGLAAAERVRCPALVVVAARDLMAPSKAAQALITALPGAKVVSLRDCGHAMMTEQPDALLDAIRAFL